MLNSNKSKNVGIEFLTWVQRNFASGLCRVFSSGAEFTRFTIRLALADSAHPATTVTDNLLSRNFNEIRFFDS